MPLGSFFFSAPTPARRPAPIIDARGTAAIQALTTRDRALEVGGFLRPASEHRATSQPSGKGP